MALAAKFQWFNHMLTLVFPNFLNSVSCDTIVVFVPAILSHLSLLIYFFNFFCYTLKISIFNCHEIMSLFFTLKTAISVMCNIYGLDCLIMMIDEHPLQ